MENENQIDFPKNRDEENGLVLNDNIKPLLDYMEILINRVLSGFERIKI